MREAAQQFSTHSSWRIHQIADPRAGSDSYIKQGVTRCQGIRSFQPTESQGWLRVCPWSMYRKARET